MYIIEDENNLERCESSVFTYPDKPAKDRSGPLPRLAPSQPSKTPGPPPRLAGETHGDTPHRDPVQALLQDPAVTLSVPSLSFPSGTVRTIVKMAIWPRAMSKSQELQFFKNMCKMCKCTFITPLYMKCCREALAYTFLSPDVRKHVCLVQPPTNDAKMSESYRNRHICQNNHNNMVQPQTVDVWPPASQGPERA